MAGARARSGVIVLDVRIITSDRWHNVHVLGVLAVVEVWVFWVIAPPFRSDHALLAREVFGTTLRWPAGVHHRVPVSRHFCGRLEGSRITARLLRCVATSALVV